MITVKLIQVSAWSYRSARQSLVDVALIELHHDQGSIELRRIWEEDLEGDETLAEAAERWIIRYVLDIDAGRYRVASEQIRLPGSMVAIAKTMPYQGEPGKPMKVRRKRAKKKKRKDRKDPARADMLPVELAHVVGEEEAERLIRLRALL